MISVVGKKDAGKTTLVVALAREFVKRGRRVATIKHGTHPAQVDTPGTDTFRHYQEGMAAQVLIEFPGGRVMFERTGEESDPPTLARRFLSADIIIVEGFTKFPLPKIEVHRLGPHQRPLYDPASPQASQWVAMVTDDEKLRLPIPILHFHDTSWLVTLANVAWDHAEQLA